MGETFKGELQGAGLHFAVVVARFNEDVTARLLSGARTAFERHGVRDDDVDVAWVPGAFELPIAARKLAESRRYDAIVCLGAVIRGETPHLDVLASSTAQALQAVAREFALPVAFGLITCENEEQAWARAGGERGNKGAEAALAAIEMVGVFARSGH